MTGDDEITLTDTILAHITVSYLQLDGIKTDADVNDDGKIGLEEAIYSLRTVAGSEKSSRYTTSWPGTVSSFSSAASAAWHIRGFLGKVSVFILCLILATGICNSPGSSAQDCLNISGSWTGFLHLENHGDQNVQAFIIQENCSLTIQTSTNFIYGRYFTGTIDEGDHLQMYDIDTGEVWTTLFTEATQAHIQLLDYVNNLTGLDELNITFLPVKGDINRDGSVTIEDALLALQILGGIHPANIDLTADVNDDNIIGMGEVLYILHTLGSH